MPKFSIFINTRYENNNGSSENVGPYKGFKQLRVLDLYKSTCILHSLQCLGLSPDELETRIVDCVDIAYDEVTPKHYKENEDPKFFKSIKTNRGPLMDGWRETHDPIMCSYKLVKVSFEVWGLQTKVEDLAQRVYEVFAYG